MARLLFSLLCCAVYVAAWVSLGARLLRWLPGRRDGRARIEDSPAAWAATALLLGQGALAGLWVLLAVAGCFTWPVVAAGVAASLAAGAGPGWACGCAFARRARELFREVRREPWLWQVLAFALIVLAALFGWATLVTSIPPHHDGASYYLALPKWLASTGKLGALPGYEGFTLVGLQAELHFGALMLAGLGQEVKLLVWPAALAGVLLLWVLGARAGLSRRAQWIVLALVFTSTAFTDLFTLGKVDLFGFALGMGAYYWAFRYHTEQRSTWLWLAGLFAGLAVVAKLSLAVPVVPGVLLLIACARRQGLGAGQRQGSGFRGQGSGVRVQPTAPPQATNDRGQGSGVRVQPTALPRATNDRGQGSGVRVQPTAPPRATNDRGQGSGVRVQPTAPPQTTSHEPRIKAAAWAMLIFAAGALLAGLPHIIKNAVLWGEPLGPFLCLGGRPELLEGRWFRPWFSPAGTERLVSLYPLMLFYGNVLGQVGTLSPLLLGYAPLLLLLPRSKGWWRSPLASLTVVAVTGIALWVCVRPAVFAPRYLLPTLLLLCLPVAAGAAESGQAEPRRRWLHGLAMFFLAFMLLAAFRAKELRRAARHTWEFVQQGQLVADGEDVRAHALLNRTAAPGARVFMAAYSLYWMRPDLLQCKNRATERPRGATAAERWAEVFDRGFRYFFLDRRTNRPFAVQMGVAGAKVVSLPEWLEAKPIFHEEDCVVLELESRDPARRPKVGTRPAANGCWEVVEGTAGQR